MTIVVVAACLWPVMRVHVPCVFTTYSSSTLLSMPQYSGSGGSSRARAHTHTHTDTDTRYTADMDLLTIIIAVQHSTRAVVELHAVYYYYSS